MPLQSMKFLLSKVSCVGKSMNLRSFAITTRILSSSARLKIITNNCSIDNVEHIVHHNTDSIAVVDAIKYLDTDYYSMRDHTIKIMTGLGQSALDCDV